MSRFFELVGAFFVGTLLLLVFCFTVMMASVGTEALNHPDCSYHQIEDHKC